VAFLEEIRRNQPAERPLARCDRTPDVDPGEGALLHRHPVGARQEAEQLREVRIVADEDGPGWVAQVRQDRVNRRCVEPACQPVVETDVDSQWRATISAV
jgi:hypothetical protein